MSRIIHRVDYHRILLNEAIRLGAVLQLDAEVKDVSAEIPNVILAGGERVFADVVIGADGTSLTMKLFLSLSNTIGDRPMVCG